MKIYIAGPITGIPDYKERFAAAEAELLSKGHTAMNPAVLPDGFAHAEYMKICFAMVDACQGAVFLTGWLESKGAVMEWDYAIKNHKSIFNGMEYVHAVEESEAF